MGGEQPAIWGNDVTAPTRVIRQQGGTNNCRYIAPPNTTGGFLSWCYSSILREDKRDGLSGKFLIEHGSSNYCFYSNDFSQATWTKTACSVTSTTGVSPDGKSDCCTVAFAGAATNKIYRTVTGLAASDDYCTSFWVRSTTGPNTVRIYNKNKDGTVYLSSDIAISTTWTRIEDYRTWSAGAGVAEVGLQNGTAGSAHSIQLWGAQVEDGPIATSNIYSTTAAGFRGADRVKCSNQYNSFGMDKIFLEGDYNFTVTPNYSSNEAVTHGVLIYGTSYSDRNGVIFTPVWNVPHNRYEYTVSLRQDSVDKYALSGLTWSRNQDLKISVDMVAGTISVSGATSGDGTSTPGTPGFTTVYGAGLPESSGNPSGLGINPVLSTAGWFGGFRISAIRTSTLTVSGTVSASQIRSDFTFSSAFSYYNSPPNTTGGFLTRMVSSPIAEDKRDGLSGFYLSEPIRQNYLTHSKYFEQAIWVKATCTVGAGYTTAPDGLIDCRTVSFTASALAGLAATCPGFTTNGSKVVCSVWARCAAGATNIRLSFLDENAVLTTSADLPISETWTRVQLNITSTGTLGGVCAMGILNGTAGVAQDIELWGAQAELVGAYYGVSSVISTTGSTPQRDASSIQIPTVPFLRDGSKFGIRVRPLADLSGTQPNKLLSVSGADGTSYLTTVLGGSTPSFSTAAAFLPQAKLNSGIAGYPTNLQVDYEADLANGILGANGVYGAATGCIGIPSGPSSTQYGFTIGYPESISSGIPIRISLPYPL